MKRPDVLGGEPEPDEEAALAELSQEEAQSEEALRMARLDALGQALFSSRKEAIEGRQDSGIEEEWQDAQDAYEGYDNANQAERSKARAPTYRQRPYGATTPKSKTTNRSTVFLNITRPYVDASAAKVADMLLPTDDRPWGLKPTPVAELVDALKSTVPVTLPNGARTTEGKLIEQILEQAKKKADRAQTRIEDWLVECDWHGEMRKVIQDAARLGTGVLKGPVPKRKRKVAIDTSGGNVVVNIHEKINPTSTRINLWNLFPDPTCGECIHNGSYIWERDDITAKALEALKGTPGYIDSQIDLVLEEGPQDPLVETEKFVKWEANPLARRPFDIWYYHGTLTRADLEAAGCNCEDMQASEQISAVLTMVNNRVIRAALNPLDSGEFPYDVLVWQRRDAHWAGIGVGQQISVAQRGVNASTRTLMDNQGVSSGPQIVMLRGVVEPADGVMEVVPNKFWYAKEDADIQDIKAAFMVFEIPTRQPELMATIEFYLRMAEEITGLPMLIQGQMGKAPDTVGGMNILQNNASSVLRRLARLVDDDITEPHIGRYYDWLLQYGEDQEEKGDFMIDARASSVLVERDIQNQAVLQLLQASTNPAFGADPRKCFAEACQAQKLDPKRFQYDDEEWEKIQKSMAEGPDDPRVVVAQMRAQLEERLKQMDIWFETQQREKDRALKASLAEMAAEVQLADQEGRKVISVDALRAKLADRTIQERSKEKLFMGEAKLKMNPQNKSGQGI